jgi:Lysophospholipase L1 and related esterases
MKIEPDSLLLMIGDSVTDCGRARSAEANAPGALGDGYVAEIDAALRKLGPEHRVRVINVGISGDTIRDLAGRWEADVLAHDPQWLSVMIGINDVWRQFRPGREAESVPLDEFEETYDRLIARVRPKLRGLILMTPFFVEPSASDAMRRRTDDYGACVKMLARRHDAVLVDTQAAFDRAIADVGVQALAPDRVHPTREGHRVLARAFLDAIGAD